ncbi:hypothetical protein BDV95DRAFT_607448 [Massariosphaeria phaeospora]|uniref:Uncharacterized protein n=1 Tax=Massariosphaeria phaeospora TaxID=100035 RepID=A0A7C8I592_9PLEO|nr:hypothetical protein BDV95DRAFT_607448 [Massariosphaeria phaeospora]
MSPCFLFKIDEIGEDRNAATLVDRLGNWIPSTDAGVNRRIHGGVSGTVWFCDKQQIYPVSQLPAGSVLFKQYSMYFGAGFGFWVLRGDATNPQDYDSWQPLRFDHSNTDYSSYLTNAGQHPTLRVQRSDQQWPRMLLPDIYHAQIWTNTQAYGGLTGDLPILLALIAHSVPRDRLPSVLPTLFNEGAWGVHQLRWPRTNQRGVVVTVYTCPSTWAGGSTTHELEQYEHGALGKYYN